MKTNENQKSTNSQPATQKPFFGAKPEQAFFSSAKEQSTPFFPRSATSKADVMGESVVQRMPAFESEVKDNGALQRKFVNSTPIQAKLTIGEPGDKYEQEADRVASQVVEQINAPAPVQSQQGQTVQRQEEKKEELQAKPDITALQRQEEKPEELQAKFTLQRREDIASGEASQDLTSAINSTRGGGQPLDASLQKSMGQAMGADFSAVRVHTDAQSDQLNRSIQAKAFTTGQDVFFRQGAYEPGSRGGQELIAHELTHVVQNNGDSDNEPLHQSSEHKSIIHRKVLINGSAPSIHTVQPFANERCENIYKYWDKSAIVHNFKSLEALRTALLRAEAQSSVKPDLFSLKNYIFKTEESGRLPTLYFRSGNDSGRLRQQHSTGPKVLTETNKTDYFLVTKEHCRDLVRLIRKERQSSGTLAAAYDEFERLHAYRPEGRSPTTGAAHVEVTGIFPDIQSTHVSAGLTSLDSGNLTEESIAEIYLQVIGKG